MATASDAPVLDTLTAMTIDSIERCGMDPGALILTRIAALVAMDAPAVSYLAHAGAAAEAELTTDQLQDVLIAIAPVVGTARVMSAASHMAEAFGLALAIAEADAQAIAEAEKQSRGND